MAAMLVEYLDQFEPLTFEDIAAQCRIDDHAERDFIERVVIPGARQAAETKSGAAIRKARYAEHLAGFPLGAFPLAIGQVLSVDGIEYRVDSLELMALDSSAYKLLQLGSETLIAPSDKTCWPDASAVTIKYQAGVDIERYPSVRSWILLAAAWAYDHRELFAKGQTITEMPGGYADVLLAPICIPPRF